MPTDLDRAWTAEELLGPLNSEEKRYAPQRLFVAGHAEWLQQSPRVAVVGARQASPDGVKRTTRLVQFLIEHDAIVVSGLASGIDYTAHTVAMERGGRTIAVIGTPLNVAYPTSHRALQARLMDEHLVVSQFPSGHPTTRKNFPLRNRTMALLCQASVIVEAGDGSGTLSQGWEALRLGRPLFLMASLLTRSDLTWPKQMLDYGAMVLRTPDDLLARIRPAVDDPLAAIA